MREGGGGLDCGGIPGLPTTTLLGVFAILADVDPSSEATSLTPVAVEEDREKGGPAAAVARGMPSSAVFSEEGSTRALATAFVP